MGNLESFMEALRGDGRKVVRPPKGFFVGHPGRIRASSARRIVAMFEDVGASFHSPAASTLWVVLAYCHATKTPYRLRFYPGTGVSVEREDTL
jgi:hypothetical protein